MPVGAVGVSEVSDDTTVGNRYLRDTAVSGSSEVSTERGGIVKNRDTVTTGEGSVDAGRSGISKTREGATSGRGEVTSIRLVHKDRTTANTGEGSVHSTQALRPVFPSEESLDVQWDFDVGQMAFATEWLDEGSIIPTDERDGLGVVLNGRLDTTIDVWVQYDHDGDGSVDVTSERKEMETTRKTLAYDDHRLFGEDGWYRVVVQGLRNDDVINQVDIGPIHRNL